MPIPSPSGGDKSGRNARAKNDEPREFYAHEIKREQLRGNALTVFFAKQGSRLAARAEESPPAPHGAALIPCRWPRRLAYRSRAPARRTGKRSGGEVSRSY